MSSWQQIQKSSNFTPSVSQVDDFQVRPFAPPEQKNENENQPPQQSTATKLTWSFGDIPVSRGKPTTAKAFYGNIQRFAPPEPENEQENENENQEPQQNTAVASPVQAKLNIGEPGDKYELEADRVASQVVEQINAPASIQSTKDQSLQRQEEGEEEELQTKPEITALQRQEEAEEEELQTKPSISELQREAMPEEEEDLQAKSILQRGEAIGGGGASTDLESTINRAKGGGQYLDAGLQQKMGQAMGANFSEVRVHTDAESDQLNQSIQARAFTTGQDVFFRQGAYEPGSQGGQELIAHELTHVVQQTGGEKLQKQEKEPEKQSDSTTDANKNETLADNQKPADKDSSIPEQEQAQGQKNKQDQEDKPESKNNSDSKEKTPPADNNKQNQSPAENKEPNNQPQGKNIDQTSNQIKPLKGDLSGSVKQGKQEAVESIGDKKNNQSQLEKSPTNPKEDPAFQSVVNKANSVATQEKNHPPAETKSTEAQAAAQPPANEVESKAQDKQVQEMNQVPQGQFNASAFKAALMEKINSIAPKNLEEADKFKNENKIDSVKGELSDQVKQEKQQASGPVEEKTKENPDPSGITPKDVNPLPNKEEKPAPPDIEAQQAAPKPKSESEVSLQEGSKQIDKQMTEGNITEEQLASSNEPEFQSALQAKKTAQTHCNEAPQAFRSQEQGILDQAQNQAQTSAQTQLQGMRGDRQQQLEQVAGLQVGTKGKDEQKRTEVANHIQGIYNNTKQKVETILNQLDGEVNQQFDAGATAAKAQFESYVGEKMDRYKADRYGGFWGWAKWLGDKLFGMPGEVNAFYDEGRKLFLASMDKTIDNIAKLVATKLNAAKTEIANGKQEIQKYVTGLDPSLHQMGQEAAENIQGQFEQLEQSVDDKKNELIDSLAQKYQENVQGIDDRINQMKEENKGLIEKAINFVVNVVKTIIELTKLLAQVLARAISVLPKILADPIGFLRNLINGIQQGFNNFISNIWEHLKKGLMGWLTGTLAGAGITIPENLDLKGLFSLATELLGLTYQAIRARAVRKMGEEKVSYLESSFELFQILVKEGVGGLWQYIQNMMGDLKALILDPIQNFVVENIIKAGILWIFSLLNPASAFVRAAKAIYDIVIFFTERASQIADLINSILDSIVAIANGNLGQAAKAIEDSLAKAIPVVISFLASLLGLDGIAQKIQGIIAKIKKPIEKGIDWVIDKGVAFAKKVGNKLKGGKDKKGNKDDGVDERTMEQKKADISKAVDDAEEIMKQKNATPDSVREKLPDIQSKYKLASIELVKEADAEYHVKAKVNPEGEGESITLLDEDEIIRTVKNITGKKEVNLTYTILAPEALILNYFHGPNGNFPDYKKEEYGKYQEFVPVAYCDKISGEISLNKDEFGGVSIEDLRNDPKFQAILIHEAQHSVSFKRKGFQKPDPSGTSNSFKDTDVSNFMDEATADYFASLTYKDVTKNDDYLKHTNYYKNREEKTKEQWHGKAIEEMIEANYFTQDDLKKAFYMGDNESMNKIKQQEENISNICNKYKN